MSISRGQIRLVLQRPTIVGTRRFGRAALQRAGDAGRWLERRMIPGRAPTVKLLVAFALTFVGLLFFVRYVIGYHYWTAGDEMCHQHEFRCGLAVHIGGTAIVAILAYYLVFLRREANAAGRWRRRARTDPNSLFAWLPPLDGLTGEARSGAATIRRRLRGGRIARWLGRRRARKALVKSIISRDEFVKALAGDLDEAAGPRIVVAPSGSGKTMVLLKLAKHLGKRGQVPIPVLLRGKHSLDFEALAHEVYRRDAGVSNHEEADKQWRWLRKRKLITVLADELEQCEAPLLERVRALQDAGRDGLRLVVCTRPDGLPIDYREGRIELDPLTADDVVDDLDHRLAHAPDGSPRLATGDLKALVERAGIAETPYYLSIARVLADKGALRSPAQSEDARLFLLDAYTEALIDCRIRPDAGLGREERKRDLRALEVVACALLLGANSPAEITSRIDQLAPAEDVDVRRTIDGALRLGVLVNRYDEQVHFGHPTTLAYFASRYLAAHKDDRGLWREVISQNHITPMLGLALALANAAADDAKLTRWIVRGLLRNGNGNGNGTRNGSRRSELSEQLVTLVGSGRLADWLEHRGNGNGHNGSSYDSGFAARTERLTAVATAAEIAGARRVRSPWSMRAVVVATRLGSVRGHEVAHARRRLVRAIGELKTRRAFEQLWACAIDRDDYPIRREAIKALLNGGREAVEVVTPRAEAAVRTVSEKTDGSRGSGAPVHDSDAQRLQAVAWAVPGLRTTAADAKCRERAALDGLQTQLFDLSRSAQRGLEASLAQGLKLDAVHHRTEPIDPMAIQMLEDPNRRAAFWFSRVLALQAVTIRGIAGDGENRKMSKAVIRRARKDCHPFVRETATLCWRAVLTRDWNRYQWDDITDVAAGTPRGLVVEATQLIGDMLVALNLNESGSDKQREAFGHSDSLPACLSKSGDRLEIIGAEPADRDCPFAIGADPCYCPYLHEQRDDSIRRELSRAFCRHQRLTARSVPWQWRMTPKSLKSFWAEMEDLARF